MKIGRRSNNHPVRACTKFEPLDRSQHVTVPEEPADILHPAFALSPSAQQLNAGYYYLDFFVRCLTTGLPCRIDAPHFHLRVLAIDPGGSLWMVDCT
jgi:hypothetical protein